MNKWKILAVVFMALAMKTKAAPGYTNTTYSATNIDYMLSTNRSYTSNVTWTASTAYSVSNSTWAVSNLFYTITTIGSLDCTTNMVVNTSSSTNYVNGWNTVITNAGVGLLTNTTFWVTNAGTYNINMGGGLIASANDVLIMQVYTNDVACDMVRIIATMTATPIIETGFKATVVTLPANTLISAKVGNDSLATTTLYAPTLSVYRLY